jgi:hypothetical protein
MRNNIITKLKSILFFERKKFKIYNQDPTLKTDWILKTNIKNKNYIKSKDQLVLLSFSDGNNDYENKSKIFYNQANNTNWFNDIKIYNYSKIKEILKKYFREDYKQIVNFFEENKKFGFGYWLWKPLLIFDAMKEYPVGTNFIYADIGCEFSIKGENILNKKICLLNKFSGVFFLMPFTEKYWSSKNLRSHLNVNKKEGKSGQISATYFLLKNNVHTKNLVNNWLTISMKDNFKYLKGIDSIYNKLFYIEHRHDQSILSLLLKRSNFVVNKQVDHFDPKYYKENSREHVLKFPVHTLRSLNEVLCD